MSETASPGDGAPAARGSVWPAALACGALLAAFAALSWSAVRTKSATFDETASAVSAWVLRHHGDYRIEYEHPPLWKRWAALANGKAALAVRLDGPAWDRMRRDHRAKWPWTVEVLYRTPGNDGIGLVARSRAMMLPLGVALGLLVAWWAFRSWGVVAAVAATATYSLDPNFLAHSALVKNDVALALLLVATCAWTWRVGRRAGVAEVIGLGLLCGACVVTKATGVLLAPIVTALLLLRAVEREPWTVLGRARATRRRRLAAALAIAVTSAALAFGVIWATYGFDPGRDPAQAVDLESLHEWVAYKTHRAEHGGERPTEGDLARWQPDAATRLVGWADRAGLFPRPWLAGVLYTRAWSTGDDTFLLGRFSYTGWWYYFPLAVLFKTPLATLAGLALAAALLARSLSRLPDTTFAQRWLAACLVVPVLVVSLTLLRANLNLGVRYVLGVVPFLYLGVGWAVARAWAWRRPGVRALILAGALGLCLESLAAHPNQLAFFNAACGGSRGGLRLLGDSNLDWGQDLPALARWQAEHRGLPLYLSYFGTADPVAHGVDSASLPGGYPFGPPPRMPSERPAVVAISATLLQGARATGPMQLLYRHLRRREPLTVLNGSLYLFRVEDFDLARLAAEAEVLGDRQATGGRAP